MGEAVIDITFKRDVPIMEILDGFVTESKHIPTEEGKAYFRDIGGKIPPKLVRQAIFAGVWFAIRHPEEIEITWESSPTTQGCHDNERIRVQEMAKAGEISGQVAYYILNGTWAESGDDSLAKLRGAEDGAPTLIKEDTTSLVKRYCGVCGHVGYTSGDVCQHMKPMTDEDWAIFADEFRERRLHL